MEEKSWWLLCVGGLKDHTFFCTKREAKDTLKRAVETNPGSRAQLWQRVFDCDDDNVIDKHKEAGENIY